MPLAISVSQALYDQLATLEDVPFALQVIYCPYNCAGSVLSAVVPLPGLLSHVLELNGAFGFLSVLFTLDEVVLDTTIAIEGKRAIAVESNGQLTFPEIDLTGSCGCVP